MKFFTVDELEKFYGRKFSEISSTDQPLDQYVNGGEIIECSECG